MKITQCDKNGQLEFLFSTHFLKTPSFLEEFNNNKTTHEVTKSNRDVFCFHGTVDISESDRKCESCGHKTHIYNTRETTLRHLCLGNTLTHLKFKKHQFVCSKCKHTKMQKIHFKADNHRVTNELYQYARDLLARSTYTFKQVAEITGLGRIRLRTLILYDERYFI